MGNCRPTMMEWIKAELERELDRVRADLAVYSALDHSAAGSVEWGEEPLIRIRAAIPLNVSPYDVHETVKKSIGDSLKCIAYSLWQADMANLAIGLGEELLGVIEYCLTDPRIDGRSSDAI